MDDRTGYTVAEVAKLLRLSERTIRQRIDAGIIRAVRIGDGERAPVRIPAREMDRLLGYQES